MTHKINLPPEAFDELLASLCNENTRLREENERLTAIKRLALEHAIFASRSFDLAVNWLLDPANRQNLTRQSSILTGPQTDIRAVLNALHGE
jgi:hypothetical protein